MYLCIYIYILFIYAVKPVNSGHLRVLKNLSVIEKCLCPLLGGNLRKIVTCLPFRMSAIGRFHGNIYIYIYFVATNFAVLLL